jgi:hypothetical protein
MHNQEIQNAFATLLSTKVVKTKAQIAKELDVSRPLVTRILSGKEKASADFSKKFEVKYLKPRGETLKDWRQPRIVPPADEESGTDVEFTAANVVMNQFLLQEILEMNARLLAIQTGEKDSARIMKTARENIQNKVLKARALSAGK